MQPVCCIFYTTRPKSTEQNCQLAEVVRNSQWLTDDYGISCCQSPIYFTPPDPTQKAVWLSLVTLGWAQCSFIVWFEKWVILRQCSIIWSSRKLGLCPKIGVSMYDFYWRRMLIIPLQCIFIVMYCYLWWMQLTSSYLILSTTHQTHLHSVHKWWKLLNLKIKQLLSFCTVLCMCYCLVPAGHEFTTVLAYYLPSVTESCSTANVNSSAAVHSSSLLC